jgi:hypothetical protein
MNQENFGLTKRSSKEKRHDEEFDTFLDYLFNDPERKAHRAEKKALNLDKKRAEIDRKNAEAQVMLSIAGGSESNGESQPEKDNTMTYAIVGGLLFIVVVGAIAMAVKSKKKASSEQIETPAAEVSIEMSEAIAQ